MRDAVRSYQSRNNLDVNGQLTQALLAHMQGNSSKVNNAGDVGNAATAIPTAKTDLKTEEMRTHDSAYFREIGAGR